MMNIVLIGFMGTGKSSVGRLLAEKLSYAFVDTDALIEERAGLSIPQMFAKFGEKYFRQREKDIIKETCNRTHTVISTGGGVPIFEANRQILQNGRNIIVCLRANIPTILNRTKGRGDRPLLKNDLHKMQALLKQRMPFYNQADFIIDTDELSPLQIVNEIMVYLRRRKK
ncbi:shikimate kinase [Pectinatus cerevisiiphilus]|uniref:Shikimate kinase n=1 Tax=Pectinatus cerevisiiphilus TaxID=86956 RepID=A0A4V2USG9_9FIRM|nr:shikimate kinase [Pectinatus cerevisiiphilus]TCS81382.1 shikimate kinase [Pectinatus cerevisiiphilus]